MNKLKFYQCAMATCSKTELVRGTCLCSEHMAYLPRALQIKYERDGLEAAPVSLFTAGYAYGYIQAMLDNDVKPRGES